MSSSAKHVDDIRRACEGFRRGDIALDDLRWSLWNVAQMTTHEEAQLRRFLLWAEGKLEILQFTVGEDQIMAETLRVIAEIEEKVAEMKDRD